MAISPLYIGADLDLDYSDARVASTDAPLNTGTCTWTLKDADGLTVGSGTLAYVAASSGDYAGVMQSTVTGALEVDAPYTLTILFSQGSYQDARVIPMRAAYRTTT